MYTKFKNITDFIHILKITKKKYRQINFARLNQRILVLIIINKTKNKIFVQAKHVKKTYISCFRI